MTVSLWRRYDQMIRSKTPWHQSDPNLAFSCFADQDAKMHHMKKASVRDFRYRFSEVERLLERGEKIEITKRKEVIGHLLPVRPSSRRRRIFRHGCAVSTVIGRWK